MPINKTCFIYKKILANQRDVALIYIYIYVI